MPAGKQYVVIRGFDRVDRRTGATTRYEPGDSYSGADIELYLAGLDDHGPLIAEKPAAPSQTAKSATSKES